MIVNFDLFAPLNLTLILELACHIFRTEVILLTSYCLDTHTHHVSIALPGPVVGKNYVSESAVEVPAGVALIFVDTELSLQHSVGLVDGSVHARNLLDRSSCCSKL